jgi:hypothetical protein
MVGVVHKNYYEVRFHLGAGENYKFWQIKNKKQKIVEYYDPFKYQLFLYNCELINKPTVANKVHKTQVRDVCGWIKCSEFKIIENNQQNRENLKMVVYDPKMDTYWHFENEQNNIDGKKFNELITVGKRAYCQNII